ncbi:MAG: hypothetical protein K2W96_08575 [Gemmataceae bacterium]|nr:hypothetical protein [Gemmataceae bacterium]
MTLHRIAGGVLLALVLLSTGCWHSCGGGPSTTRSCPPPCCPAPAPGAIVAPPPPPSGYPIFR